MRFDLTPALLFTDEADEKATAPSAGAKAAGAEKPSPTSAGPRADGRATTPASPAPPDTAAAEGGNAWNFGGGGFLFGLLSFRFGHQPAGVPNALRVFGGGGSAHVAEDLRLSLYGLSASSDERLHSTSVGGALLRADYVMRPWENLEVDFGPALGGGGYTFSTRLARNQDRNRSEVFSQVDGGFFLAGGMAGVSYYPDRNVRISLEAGYFGHRVLGSTNGSPFIGLMIGLGY